MILKPFFFATLLCGNLFLAQNIVNTEKKQNFEVYQDFVDQTPNFPGGINAFRMEVHNKIMVDPGLEIGALRTEVTFVIEKDGHISNIKAVGNNESLNKSAKKAIRSIKEKWTPAIKDGKPVRYLFKLPLRLIFE